MFGSEIKKLSKKLLCKSLHVNTHGAEGLSTKVETAEIPGSRLLRHGKHLSRACVRLLPVTFIYGSRQCLLLSTKQSHAHKLFLGQNVTPLYNFGNN